MWNQLFHLSPDSNQSLQSQLRQSLVRAILDGHIPVELPLPSSRELARQLGVARNTVILAYQHLIDEKYLIAQERRGYFVNPEILDGRVERIVVDRETGARSDGPDWQLRLGSGVRNRRTIERPLDWQRFQYPFIYGQVDPSLFPVNDWRECTRLSLHVSAIGEWSNDSVDNDDELLVEQILTRVLPRRGVWASRDEILITTGAQNALFLLGQLLLREQKCVGIEDPCYVDARNMFSLFTDQRELFAVGHDGVVTDDRLSRCDVLYVTPSHQCPTTTTIPLNKRYALLEDAALHDVVIIEDDYESELNFAGEPTPALKSLDRDNRVIYVGSLSKTLAPGLRVGFMVGAPELIREARALRRLMYRHPPSNNQRTVGHFLALGHYDSMMLKISQTFRERFRIMDRALSQHMDVTTKAPAFGGSSFWVALPKHLSAAKLEHMAAEQGIVLNAGDNYFASRQGPGHFFRLGFSSIAESAIEPGIQKLADVVRKLSKAAE